MLACVRLVISLSVLVRYSYLEHVFAPVQVVMAHFRQVVSYLIDSNQIIQKIKLFRKRTFACVCSFQENRSLMAALYRLLQMERNTSSALSANT